ncbi:hypothetical protein FOL47_009096, partial [Perkinsus chesapeaki]
MAFVRNKKGNWDGIYEPSDDILGMLGRLTEPHNKGEGLIYDLSTDTLVKLRDDRVDAVEEEDPKRKVLRYMPNPPYDPIIMSVSNEGYSISTGDRPAPKVSMRLEGTTEVGEDSSSSSSSAALDDFYSQSPYVVLTSKLADEKHLVLLSEGKEELEKRMNFLVCNGSIEVFNLTCFVSYQGGKDKKAAAVVEEVKEGKSDVEMAVVFPRFTFLLTGQSKGARIAEDEQQSENYVKEVVVGGRLSGKLSRGKPYISEEDRERMEEERIAKEKEDKKNKKAKGKKAAAAEPVEPPMIKEYAWEVSNVGGTAIDEIMEDASPGEEGSPHAIGMEELWGYIDTWMEMSSGDPETWEAIFLRSEPVERLIEKNTVQREGGNKAMGSSVARISLPWVLNGGRDEYDVMMVLAEQCGIESSRLRPISSTIRENKTIINFKVVSDNKGSSEDVIMRMEDMLGGDPEKDVIVKDFITRLKLLDEDEEDDDDTDTRPSEVDDDSDRGSSKGSNSFYFATKSTFSFMTQNTFTQAVVAATEVNDYSKDRIVITNMGMLGVHGAGLVTCRYGHGVAVNSIDELRRDVEQLRLDGDGEDPLCAKYDDIKWRRCDWCRDEGIFFEYRCTVCDDHAWICGICSIGQLVVCPTKHCTCGVEACIDEHFIPCEGCGIKGRRISIECAFGGHYRRRLCSDCIGRELYGTLLSTSEPIYAASFDIPPQVGVVQHIRGFKGVTALEAYSSSAAVNCLAVGFTLTIRNMSESKWMDERLRNPRAVGQTILYETAVKEDLMTLLHVLPRQLSIIGQKFLPEVNCVQLNMYLHRSVENIEMCPYALVLDLSRMARVWKQRLMLSAAGDGEVEEEEKPTEDETAPGSPSKLTRLARALMKGPLTKKQGGLMVMDKHFAVDDEGGDDASIPSPIIIDEIIAVSVHDILSSDKEEGEGEEEVIENDNRRDGIKEAIREDYMRGCISWLSKMKCMESRRNSSIRTSSIDMDVGRQGGGGVVAALMGGKLEGVLARLMTSSSSALPTAEEDVVNEDLPTNDPQELMQLARLAREKGDLDRACNLLGDACEITCRREGTDTCKEMAEVLFEFGDCLLAKEEDSLDVFNNNDGENGGNMDNVLEGSSSSKSAMDRLQEAVDIVKAAKEKELQGGDDGGADAESDVEDLQLAWENLEQCRNCLELFSDDEMPWSLARRCHSRLGDFLQLQERYPQACEEFEKALEVCDKEKPSDGGGDVDKILLRLGECQRESDKDKGRMTLNKAKEMLEEIKEDKRDEETDNVLSAIKEALEDDKTSAATAARGAGGGEEVNIIKRLMASASSTGGVVGASSTSAIFDKATLSSTSKVMMGEGTMGCVVAELGAHIADIEQKHMAEMRRQDREIQSLKDRIDALRLENEHLTMQVGVAEAASDPLARRVEWTITGIREQLKACPKNVSIWSPEFSACGIRNMQLEFFPQGRETATLEGFCSVFFWCPEGTNIKYQLFVGNHYRAPDEDSYDSRMGHGHSNFCFLEAEIDQVSDSITVGVAILDVSRVYEMGRGEVKIHRSSLNTLMCRAVSVVENRDVTLVEWKIDKITRKLAVTPRGASLYSPIFTAAGIRDMLLEFYPSGNANTRKDGYCSLYLRCPEGTQIVVTLIVGTYKKGPIMAKFDGSAGKGLPEFCELTDQINKDDDTITVGLELKNAAPGFEGSKKTVLRLENNDRIDEGTSTDGILNSRVKPQQQRPPRLEDSGVQTDDRDEDAVHHAQASSSSGVQAVDELYRKEDNPTQAAPCHAGARQTTKSTAFTPDSAGRIEMKNLQLENELLKARVRALDMDEGIMKRSSRRGGDENRSYLPAEHALLEELRDVKKHLAESEQRNEENTLEKGKIEKELEAVRSRYDNLLAENNTLHLGEDKFKLMEVEISALSDEVDRLTKELKRERHSRNESTDEEVRALKCHISRLEHDRRAELAAASVEARVETAKIESLTQLLREERQKNSELAKQLDDAARAEIELMKANSLQERSVRDETATKRAEAQLTKCWHDYQIHRKNGELDKALEELRVNEEKLERANERIREANKELKSTHGKIDELKQCVRGMQRQLSNVDRVSTDLTSVTAERDRLVKKLNDKDARLSTAIEEIELLKEAFEQESSQRQLADLQCQNIQEELDRVKRELEKSRRINDDILLDKETGGKKVQEQQRMVQESKIPSLSKQHDHSRQLVTMSLDDYNAEAVRVEEIIAELTKERQKFQVLSQEVTKLRNENDELRARSRRIDDISWDESIQEQ